MSSGNPFRTSLAPNQAPSSPVPRASFITPETSRPEADTQHDDVPAHAVSPPPRTKKHVRIESTAISIPPQPDVSSPDDSPVTSFAPQPASAQHAGLPLPATYAGYSNTQSPGAYTREPGRSYDMAAPDTMASLNSASGMNYPVLSHSVVPANPFTKTLASMEPQRAGGDERASAEGAAPGNNRASLDVESFKNMLLTGRPYPRQTTQAPQPPAPSSASAAIVESGSSTDASSISRQSLLEPAQEAPAESPRTSYEMGRSDEDEVAGLAPERTRSKKKPPPAPAHRHGKLVSPRHPQTVPFDSFTVSEAAPSPVTRPRNTSDTSKPLPPTPILSPPPLTMDTPDKPPNNASPPTGRTEDSLSRSNSLQQKRAPPPVPLARRQSQLRQSSAENRSRSSSSLTLSSQHSLDVPPAGLTPTPGEVASNATTTPSLKAPPPPPPPSRHGARLSDIGSSSANSSSTELPQRSISARTSGSSRGPSSRRSTLEGEREAPISRTASTASKRNSLRLASSESGSGMPPPPPPPPRRRPGSGRSSLDQQRPFIPSSSPTEGRRTSTEHRRTSADLRRTSLDNNRRASGASEHSLRHEYAPAEDKSASEYALSSPREEAEVTLASATVETRKDSNNILDDMEKFQREIDELRNRYKQAG